jgi:hypothetical protein
VNCIHERSKSSTGIVLFDNRMTGGLREAFRSTSTIGVNFLWYASAGSASANRVSRMAPVRASSAESDSCAALHLQCAVLLRDRTKEVTGVVDPVPANLFCSNCRTGASRPRARLTIPSVEVSRGKVQKGPSECAGQSRANRPLHHPIRRRFQLK